METSKNSFEEIYIESELPDVLKKEWTILSCLAYSEDKRIFLIKKKEEELRYILKWKRKGTEGAGRLYAEQRPYGYIQFREAVSLSADRKIYRILSNALSFDLYNEPPEFVTDEQYTAFIKKTLDVVTPANPDRIIFVDMLNYGKEPVYGLEGEPVAQCFHCYDPAFRRSPLSGF